MKSKSTFRYKAGQYYYSYWHRGIYGVWFCNSVSETGMISSHIDNFWSREAAENEVYSLNGWNKKGNS